MGKPFTLRRATVEDIDLLVDLRDAMWREIAGEMDLGDVSEALGNTRAYFEHAVPSGEYVCLLAEAEGRVVKPATERGHGWREVMVEDPDGYVWAVGVLSEPEETA